MAEERVLNAGNELDRFVAAYEAARAGDAPVDLRAFLPGLDHPLYGEVLRELVRVDLEYGWARGRPRSLEDYQRDFPQMFQDAEDLQAVTFEEYRLRRQAGEDPDPEAYRQRFGVDVGDWPAPRHPSARQPAPPASVPGRGALSWFFQDVRRSDPQAARQLARALADMPAAGTEFLGFHLLAELGRGTFGRVYLARQGELADRPVALKVSGDVLGESRTLAQLQHTNIIPIFSVHHANPFHAVCMPFLGSTTLEDVLHDLRGQQSLPGSGRALVDTVNARKSRTRGGEDSRPSQPRSEGTTRGPRPEPGANAVARGGEPVVSLKALEGLTYVQAVLGITARLADGLAHAHERGILHRDLKPANVLLTDDGQPILLDFNLSEDTKLRSSASAAFVGGTLPYMAPEQLLAFRQRARLADARGDLYSLGVILFELLTGRHPFPSRGGLLQEVLARMIEDRRPPPPRLRPWNPAVSPAVEAIVRHCLEPEPGQRYQTARELQEDLERHLKDLPLRHAGEPSPRERARKWVRRHPRLTSSTGVATLAAILLLALGGLFAWRQERLARLEAAESLHRFRAEVREAQILFLDLGTGQASPQDIVSSCRRALDRYEVLTNPVWQQAAAFRRLPPEDQGQVRADAGELLFLLAALAADAEADPSGPDSQLRRALDLNSRAESCYPQDEVPTAVLRQRAALVRRLGEPAEAERLMARAETTPLRTPRDHCLLACAYATQGRFRQALPLWQEASFRDPQNVWTWYGLGNCYDRLGRPAQAAECYSACVALNPTFHGWYFRRGLAHLEQGQHPLAGADFDQAIRLRPGHGEAYVNRAVARLNDNHGAEAVEDLTRALELGVPAARVQLIRAQAREKAGDRAGAERDRAEALRGAPADEAAWVARGVARVAGAPADALADFDRALDKDPRYLPALENRAHVLAERLGRTEDAVRALDRAIILYPECGRARAARGVLLARLGKREAALQDARGALAVDDSPATLYQVAGVYALTSRQKADDRRETFPLLAAALRQGFGYDLIGTDRDLDPIRDDPRFRQLLEAVSALRPTPSEPAGRGRDLEVPSGK
jgi:serine/threonine protein kinase/Tfp pilus assembly protein PilF